jgi:hypothetical protein
MRDVYGWVTNTQARCGISLSHAQSKHLPFTDINESVIWRCPRLTR